VKKPAKTTAAIGAGAATAGAGAVAGSGGAMAAGGGFSALGNAARGRVARTAYSVMNLHRGLSNATFGSSNGAGSADPDAGSSSGGVASDPSSGGGIRSAPTGSPQSRSSPSPDSNGTAAQARLPDTGRNSMSSDSADELGSTVRYWDVLDDGATVEDQSPDLGAVEVPSEVTDLSDGDDDVAAGAAPTTNGGDGGDPPATGGAANVEDLFATDSDVLGPDAYRSRDGSSDS